MFLHETGGMERKREKYLLDQEVKVLGKLGGEACLNHSVSHDQAEAMETGISAQFLSNERIED